MGFLSTALTILGIIAIIIIAYSIIRVTPKKYYKKARKAHKKGEIRFQKGETELAEDYFDESHHYRKKALELENVV